MQESRFVPVADLNFLLYPPFHTFRPHVRRYGGIRYVRVLDVLLPEPGAFYVMDRGYLDFLTNSFAIPSTTVAELYRYRWKVELFFEWIKQHFRIKSFYGTFENAVKSQVIFHVDSHDEH